MMVDFSIIERFIPNVAAWLNLDPSTVLFLWIVFGIMCNLGSKLIPEDAEGWLGYLRKGFAFFGANVETRITKGVKVTQAVKGLAVKEEGPPPDEALEEVAETPKSDPIEDYLAAVQRREDESK